MTEQKKKLLGWTLFLIAVFLWVGFGSRLFNDIYVKPRGTESDFYLIWHGAQELWQGHTPYTDEVTRDIQLKIVGEEVSAGGNEFRFVYPAYSAFVFLPFTTLDFQSAYLYWLTVQPIFLIASVTLLVKAFFSKASPLLLVLLLLIAFSMYYFWLGMALAQTGIFILFLFSVIAYLSSRGYDSLAAIPLAIATVKPQLVFFVIAGWVLWFISKRYWRPILVLVGLGFSLVLLPMPWIGFWMPGFLRQISAYWGYTGAASTLTLAVSYLVGEQWVTLALFLAVLLAIFSLWKISHVFNDRLPALGMSVIFTLLIVPLSFVYDLILLLLPLIYITIFQVGRDAAFKYLKISWIILMPVLSWMPLALFHFRFNRYGVSFDAVSLDKIMLPTIVFLIFSFLLLVMHNERGNITNEPK